MSIPLNDIGRQHRSLAPALAEAVARVLERGWYVHGEEHAAFEQEFAAFCRRRHCIAVGNGTDALELALRAVGTGPGDEVVTAANAGGYASLAALALGAVPVLADVREADLTLDPAAAVRLVGPRCKAVIATHLYGKLADMSELAGRLADTGAAVIEDCAQAHGALRDGRPAGAFALIGTFSFYPSKNLGAAGDGGAVICDDDALAARLRALRQYGWDERYRAVTPGGRNSRLDELQAAVLRLKLPHLAAWNERRRAIVARYRQAADGTRLGLVHRPGPDYVAHLCVARHPERAAFRQRLAQRGIASAIHYPFADHQQPAIAGRALRPLPLPVTERAVGEIVTLPCFPEMSDAEVAAVAAAIEAER